MCYFICIHIYYQQNNSLSLEYAFRKDIIIKVKEDIHMKKLLFAVFENEEDTVEIITKLAQHHINGTAIESSSLKHILDSTQETSDFISLRHLTHAIFEDNATFYSVLNEDTLAIAQDIIRQETANFTKIKGGMFVLPIESFEGTF
jgi:regulatory protein YycH of two-component signal transduction system YycFG